MHAHPHCPSELTLRAAALRRGECSRREEREPGALMAAAVAAGFGEGEVGAGRWFGGAGRRRGGVSGSGAGASRHPELW